MIVAVLLAAAALSGDPAPVTVEGLIQVPPGSVIHGVGQGAVVETPHLRVTGTPSAGAPPQVCTIVDAYAVSIWQASGCVYIHSGLDNRVNGRLFGAGSKVCIGHRFHPSLCGSGLRLPTLPRFLRPAPAPPGAAPQ